MSKSVHVHVHGALTQDNWTEWNKNHATAQKPQRSVPLRHQVANHQREMGSFLAEHGKTQAEFDKLKKAGHSPNEIRMLWEADKRDKAGGKKAPVKDASSCTCGDNHK